MLKFTKKINPAKLQDELDSALGGRLVFTSYNAHNSLIRITTGNDSDLAQYEDTIRAVIEAHESVDPSPVTVPDFGTCDSQAAMTYIDQISDLTEIKFVLSAMAQVIITQRRNNGH